MEATIPVTPLMALIVELRDTEERRSFNAVAERSGVSTSHLTKMANGSRPMDLAVANKLAAAYPDFVERIYEAAEPNAEARPLAAYLEPEEVDYLAAEAERRHTSPGTVLREAVARYRAESSEDNPVADVPCRHARCSPFKHGLDHVITPNPPRLAAAA